MVPAVRAAAPGTTQLESAASLSRMPKRFDLHSSIPASHESSERTDDSFAVQIPSEKGAKPVELGHP
jgi:hypothetical protein